MSYSWPEDDAFPVMQLLPWLRLKGHVFALFGLLTLFPFAGSPLNAATINFNGYSGPASGVTINGVTFSGGQFADGGGLNSSVIFETALWQQQPVVSTFLSFNFTDPVMNYSFSIAYYSNTNFAPSVLIETYDTANNLAQSDFLGGGPGEGARLVEASIFVDLGQPISSFRVVFHEQLHSGIGFYLDDLSYLPAGDGIPEPSTFVLGGTALAGLALWQRQRRPR